MAKFHVLVRILVVPVWDVPGMNVPGLGVEFSGIKHEIGNKFVICT